MATRSKKGLGSTKYQKAQKELIRKRRAANKSRHEKEVAEKARRIYVKSSKGRITLKEVLSEDALKVCSLYDLQDSQHYLNKYTSIRSLKI